MEQHYCWRCDAIVPLLDEKEWSLLAPLLDNMVHQIKEYRETHGCDIKSAQAAIGKMVLEVFNERTGFNEENYLAIYHHRRSKYGNVCRDCGQLYRTPQAKHCANCGSSKDVISIPTKS